MKSQKNFLFLKFLAPKQFTVQFILSLHFDTIYSQK